jgi:haloacetate dehalogenase
MLPLHNFYFENNELRNYCLIMPITLGTIATMFTDFTPFVIERSGVKLQGRIGGQGTPLLLLHGHPQTHAMWHRVAPDLAKRHTVVMMDLRGYGDSGRPESDEAHATYSKREMARDAMAVMHSRGFDQFQVLAHDRGARVAHRLAADNPHAVQRMLLLDIAPTLGMYSQTSQAFATAYWHWYFLIQPPPMPEALIESDPVGYLRYGKGQRHGGLSVFAPEAMAEYERCIQIPGSARGICEDYRASATIDLVHDRADIAAGKKLAMPLKVLWAEQGAVGKNFDVLALWRERAQDVSGQSLPCGHYIAEETPNELLAHAYKFFTA